MSLVLKPVDFLFWSLRLISLELRGKVLGSKQVELWVIFRVFVFHYGFFFFFFVTMNPPMAQGQYD